MGFQFILEIEKGWNFNSKQKGEKRIISFGASGSIMHWPFGKYWFTKLCISSNIDVFHYTISKKYSLKQLPTSLETF